VSWKLSIGSDAMPTKALRLVNVRYMTTVIKRKKPLSLFYRSGKEYLSKIIMASRNNNMGFIVLAVLWIRFRMDPN
jgi:hypothetical protein